MLIEPKRLSDYANQGLERLPAGIESSSRPERAARSGEIPALAFAFAFALHLLLPLPLLLLFSLLPLFLFLSFPKGICFFFCRCV
jgi:hypothetical protein